MPELLKAVLLVLVLCAGIWDLKVRRIPNWLTAPAVLAGIAINAWLTPHGIGVALAGVICAMAIYLPLYMIRGMGAGDVKLMAAVGAIVGPSNWVFIFLATALIAGAASLVLVAARRRIRETSRNIAQIVVNLLARRIPGKNDPALDVHDTRALRMPHGAFIASGSMLFLILSRVQ
jgi:prepilin peptidase CpaA